MSLVPFIVMVGICVAYTDSASCENGWIAYKDEVCLKAINTLATYDEARNLCADEGSDSSLIMIKESDYQDFISEQTDDMYNYVWLGGRYNARSGLYTWEDGEPLSYTNWQGGYPRNRSPSKNCIELRPPQSRTTAGSASKWADVPCRKRNLVMCQKPLPWSLDGAVEEIKRMRRELEKNTEALRNELANHVQALQNELTNEMEALRKERANDMQALKKQQEEGGAAIDSRVFPVGAIYIEYPRQPNPQSLWPNLTWQDVTASYAGLFFRALGGGSENWGVAQTECAPRIDEIGTTRVSHNGIYLPDAVSVPIEGKSQWVRAGHYMVNPREYFEQYNEAMRLSTRNCEVRPKNQAIRIWKRIA